MYVNTLRNIKQSLRIGLIFFIKVNKKSGILARIGRKEANTGTGRKSLEKRNNFQELGFDGTVILKQNSHILYLKPKMGREDVERTHMVQVRDR
jgi:hypothetical protein